MGTEIRKLTPELLDDYLYFFEQVAHTDNKEWDRCYCLNYCSADHRDEDFRSPEVRREYAIQYVQTGKISGYLAYQEGNVIGWCNTNRKSACLGCYGLRWLRDDARGGTADSKVKSVFCFTVAPRMRRKGVARLLLERVCQDAKRDGYEYLEAYPNKQRTDEYYDYVGPSALYKEFGFVLHKEVGDRLVLRKRL